MLLPLAVRELSQLWQQRPWCLLQHAVAAASPWSLMAMVAEAYWRRGKLTLIATGTNAMLTTLTINDAVMELETRRRQDIHVIVLLLPLLAASHYTTVAV